MSSASPPSSRAGSSSHALDFPATNTSSLEQLKALQDKKTTKDGKTPKKRGPKPDTKPALTRRQELNRQAQRTHRERKEMYIKALEDEVLRLKQVYTGSNLDKQKLAEENRDLRALLEQHGIQPPASSDSAISITSPAGGGHASSRGLSFSEAPPQSSTTYSPPAMTASSNPQHMDYEQAGIDFVLTLEHPCMSHVRMVRGIADEVGLFFGHAMMGSCPLDLRSKAGPHHHEAVPRDESSDTTGTVHTGELTRADLATLLDLSKKLNLDGEITPVMAWGALMNHPLAGELDQADLVQLAEELQGKIRCYGFGAVFEEFELRDALEAVLGSKSGSPMVMC